MEAVLSLGEVPVGGEVVRNVDCVYRPVLQFVLPRFQLPLHRAGTVLDGFAALPQLRERLGHVEHSVRVTPLKLDLVDSTI